MKKLFGIMSLPSTSELLGVGAAVVAEPFLNQGFEALHQAVPQIPVELMGIQVDDVLKATVVPSLLGKFGGSMGKNAGSALRIIALARIMDGFIGNITTGASSGASTTGGDSW